MAVKSPLKALSLAHLLMIHSSEDHGQGPSFATIVALHALELSLQSETSTLDPRYTHLQLGSLVRRCKQTKLVLLEPVKSSPGSPVPLYN